MDHPITHALSIPINKGLMIAYASMMGVVFTLDVDFKTIISVLSVLAVNLVALLKWGFKVEKAITRNEERTGSLIEKIDLLSEMVMLRSTRE